MTTRARILEEALKAFNDRGIHQVGVREIARNLNISPGNMSYHFPKKEDLLLEIIEAYSSINQQHREFYINGPATLSRFINMFKSLFENQYAHRGILSELIEVNRLLKAAKGFDYAEGQAFRIVTFQNMIRGLQDSQELKPDEHTRSHLISFITLFGRFWITEAFLSDTANDREAVISHYLNVLKNQLLLHATGKGKTVLNSITV